MYKAVSYGSLLKPENGRFRTAKPFVNLSGSETGIFSVRIFADISFRDGLHPEVGVRFRIN